ncbi:CobD/CbiB family cobalamin biosynthesis protein [Halobacterium jilantaiense]|uniref:Probable cobalamin biosynthesis protein CobD n=1 Tax=Halobacterium jilantaiense TaxID=355548 RepID=A0A1I0QMC2_9EURY|nr:CobD/CbiB family cobalamin biosynthesis protein [Halobacterium jilantaiense]SEW28354.1 adenosylcobinamide-phosphate synthase [Halobacterium jilantaiense]
MSAAAAGAVAVAFALEAAVAEPPTRLHPVAWLGRAIAPFDREWTRPLAVGALVAVALPLAAAGAVAGLVAVAAEAGELAAGAVAGLALFSATSLRMLLGEARAVVAATGDDPAGARERLRSLAGRDSTDLSAGELRSAAVESAAENLADGLVAPLLAFAAGALVSLPVAAGLAAWVKAVNTLDSMLGYRSKRVGTPSARLDDAVMWLPARLSALLVAAAARDPDALARARDYAAAPPSPNSGWPMATLAAVLGRRLAKPGVYDLPLGAEFPTAAESQRGVRDVGVAGVLAYLLTGLVAYAAGSGVVAWS